MASETSKVLLMMAMKQMNAIVCLQCWRDCDKAFAEALRVFNGAAGILVNCHCTAKTPFGSGFRDRTGLHILCGRSSARVLFEAPQQCHWLTLRDSSCLFKWQCCNDSRRQAYCRQDPLDYFVSDIKRSSYTQWETSRARRMSASTLKLIKLRKKGGRKKCQTFQRSKECEDMHVLNITMF